MKKSLLRKRLLMLSALLLMVCGQMWADYSNGKPDYGTRCNGNSPAKTVIVDGVMYSLYSNQNYIYTFENYTYNTSESGDYAVAVYAEKNDTRTELTIKSTVQDGDVTYTVVAIGEQFFDDNKTATKLTIPETVQILETFALEDNTSKLSEIVIEDSKNQLECYRTTNSYGAFSWNGGLKKVYIGRDLHAMGGTEYYYYAPFYKGDFSDLEVTFGPLVGCIPQYTFYNNSIKSIKAMPQTPPTCGTDAFYGVTNDIPVYVSYKTKSAYTSASGWNTFINYAYDKDLCKADALNDLDLAAGQNPSDAILAIVSDYKTRVNAATNGDAVVAEFYAGMGAIQLQKAKETAIAALNTEAGDSPSQAVAGVRDTWIANVNKATTVDDVNTCKSNGIAAIQLQKAKDSAIDALNDAKKDHPSDAADEIVSTYTGKINAATSTTDVTNEKEAGIKALMDAKDLQDAKAVAIDALNEAAKTYPSDAANGIVTTYTAKINAATSTTDVTNEKEAGIKALMDAKDLQDAKAVAIDALNEEAGDNPSDAVKNILNGYTTQINAATSITDVETQKNNGIAAIKLQKEKETAIAALNAAKETYPSYVADEIVSTYTGKINAATSTDAITAAKNEGVQALKDANELQEAKEAAISYLNDAKKDYPSDEFEDIVSIYTYKINAATSTDAVTAIKNEGIQALAYAAEMPTVLHINFAEGSAPIEKEHYMKASKFTLDEDCNVVLTVNGKSVTYPWDMAGKITLFKGAPTVELKASKDPNGSKYYTTFYSSLEAYTLPEGVKAYTATVDEKRDGVIILNEIKDGVVPAETAVVLISESDTYEFDYCNYVAGDADNDLQGKDVETSAPANCYILSGTTALGMGLYPWAKGKTLSANKAYLQLTESSPAKAFRFVFDDEEADAIHNPQSSTLNHQPSYNLQGIRVNDSYKGIVIKNGKKTLNK